MNTYLPSAGTHESVIITHIFLVNETNQKQVRVGMNSRARKKNNTTMDPVSAVVVEGCRQRGR